MYTYDIHTNLRANQRVLRLELWAAGVPMKIKFDSPTIPHSSEFLAQDPEKWTTDSETTKLENWTGEASRLLRLLGLSQLDTHVGAGNACVLQFRRINRGLASQKTQWRGRCCQVAPPSSKWAAWRTAVGGQVLGKDGDAFGANFFLDSMLQRRQRCQRHSQKKQNYSQLSTSIGIFASEEISKSQWVNKGSFAVDISSPQIAKLSETLRILHCHNRYKYTKRN